MSGASCQISSSTETRKKSKSKKNRNTKPPPRNNKMLSPLTMLNSKPNKLGRVKPPPLLQLPSKIGPLPQLPKLKTGPLRLLVVPKTGLKLTLDKVGNQFNTCILQCNKILIFNF